MQFNKRFSQASPAVLWPPTRVGKLYFGSELGQASIGTASNQQAPTGADGSAGPTGSTGANDATRVTDASGATGANGAADAAGATGPAGFLFGAKSVLTGDAKGTAGGLVRNAVRNMLAAGSVMSGIAVRGSVTVDAGYMTGLLNGLVGP